MSFDNETCETCRYLSIGDGFWSDECELAGRELTERDEEESRPAWCPLTEEED